MNTPVRRLVLLGASNVVRGLREICWLGPQLADGPLEILGAMGHGRAFSVATWAPIRLLPAILDCDLWSRLHDAPPLPTYVLITDVGNDLVFGRTPETLVAHVAECVRRVRPLAERLVLTLPPVMKLRRLPAWQFYLLRRLFFPKATLTHALAMDYASELHTRLSALAREWAMEVIDPELTWYGFDPIHIRSSMKHAVWNRILGVVFSKDEVIAKKIFLKQQATRGLRSLLPARSVVLGRARVIEQPSALLVDGTRVSYY